MSDIKTADILAMAAKLDAAYEPTIPLREWGISGHARRLVFSGPVRHKGTTPKDHYLRRYVRRGWHRAPRPWPSLSGLEVTTPKVVAFISDELLADPVALTDILEAGL